MIETIEYNNKIYPKFQTKGFAAQYVHPFAKNVCVGMGFDIGCNRNEWCFPGAVPIDLEFDDEWHALNLPYNVDYIFSSHCLEHILEPEKFSYLASITSFPSIMEEFSDL